MCNYNSKLRDTHKQKVKNDKNIYREELSKNGSAQKMCSNLRDHQLKIDCYKHSLVYMKHMITTNKNL